MSARSSGRDAAVSDLRPPADAGPSREVCAAARNGAESLRAATNGRSGSTMGSRNHSGMRPDSGNYRIRRPKRYHKSSIPIRSRNSASPFCANVLCKTKPNENGWSCEACHQQKTRIKPLTKSCGCRRMFLARSEALRYRSKRFKRNV